MIALAQHRRDRASLEVGGACVQRCLEAASGAIRKRLIAERFRRTDHAGHQPSGGFDDRHRRDLTAAQHVVTDRQLLADLVARTLIDALIAAADKEDRAFGRELVSDSLIELTSLRREQDAPDVGLGFAQRAHRAYHRFRLEHHARPSAERDVVDLAMPAFGVRAKVVHGQLHVAGSERTADHADAERTREHLGKDREHVEADHTVSSIHGATVIVPASTSIAIT